MSAHIGREAEKERLYETRQAMHTSEPQTCQPICREAEKERLYEIRQAKTAKQALRIPRLKRSSSTTTKKKVQGPLTVDYKLFPSNPDIATAINLWTDDS
jgi:hypothetical protein